MHKLVNVSVFHKHKQLLNRQQHVGVTMQTDYNHTPIPSFLMSNADIRTEIFISVIGPDGEYKIPSVVELVHHGGETHVDGKPHYTVEHSINGSVEYAWLYESFDDAVEKYVAYIKSLLIF